MRLLGRIIDFTIIHAIIFIVLFTWARFYFSAVSNAALASLVATVFIGFLLHLRKSRKNRTTALKANEERHKDKVLTQLVLQGEQKTRHFFFDFFVKKFGASIYKDIVVLEQADTSKKILDHENQVAITPKKITCVFMLFEETLSSKHLIRMWNIARKYSVSSIVVLCNDVEKGVMDLKVMMKQINTKILDRDWVYLLLKRYSVFPQLSLTLERPRGYTFKQLVAFSLNRSRTRGYLITGLFLVLSGFITGYTTYYLVICTIVLGLALFSYLNPFYNKSENDAIEKAFGV
ncbi:MAG: hypothetical protein FWB72_07115 [Firmicutes bacterium]|nr:hypothetical protein [Bacillota bacterium]